MIKLRVPWDLGMKSVFQETWRFHAIWLVIFEQLKARHTDPFVTIEV